MGDCRRALLVRSRSQNGGCDQGQTWPGSPLDDLGMLRGGRDDTAWIRVRQERYKKKILPSHEPWQRHPRWNRQGDCKVARSILHRRKEPRWLTVLVRRS